MPAHSITLQADPPSYCNRLGGPYVSCYGTGHQETLGVKKMIAIRVRFQNDDPWDPSKDEAWARSKMAELNSWLVENSYGQMQLNNNGTCCGDVYPQVVSIPINASCDYNTLSQETMKALDPLIDFHQYHYIWFIREPEPDPNLWCPASGSTGSNWLGSAERFDLPISRDVFLAYQWNDYATGMDNGLMHEFEHGLWIFHSDYPHGEPVGCHGCDDFDVMGSGFANGSADDTDAIHKEMIGWLKPGRMMTVNQSGTFTIEESELQTPPGHLKVLKIGPPNTEPLYVEMRALIGFDVNIPPQNLRPPQPSQGVVLHRVLPAILSARTTTVSCSTRTTALTGTAIRRTSSCK